MKFCVKELLKRKGMERLKIIAGEQCLDNEIKGVTIIEAPDIVRFINGGEVLITGLYAFKTSTLKEMADRLAELDGKKISALVVKRGRNVEQAEEKINLFRDSARRWGVPVLEMPFDMSFKDIVQTVMAELFSEEVRQLKYFKSTRDNFEALILALKPDEDGIVKLLTVLGKLIGNPVGIYDSNGVCLGETKNSPVDIEESAPLETVEPKAASTYSYMRRKVHIYGEDRDVFQYLVNMKKVFGAQIYLAVTETGAPLDSMDYVAIESAVSALQYELAKKYAVLELEKKYQNDILHSILEGDIHSIEEMKKNIGLLGMAFGSVYRVFVFGIEYKKGKEPKDINLRVNDLNMLKNGVNRHFPKAIILNDYDRVIVVHEETEVSKEKLVKGQMQDAVKYIQKQVTDLKRNFRIKVGVGKKAEGVLKLKNSYKEAAEALEFLDIAGDVFGENATGVLMFSDMGILKLLSGLKTKEQLIEFIPESLQRLYYDKKGQKGDLMITLRTYLDYNQNLMKTAQELHVHYKTVAYRIEKIADMTGMQFDDAGEMLSVRIGIIVCSMLDKFQESENIKP